MRLYLESLESLESSSDLRIFHSKPTFNGFHASPWTPDHVGPRHQQGQELFQLALQVLHLWQEQHQAMSLVGPLGHREELRPPGGLLLAMGEPVDGDSLGQNSFFWGENYIEDVLKFWDLAFFLEQKTDPCAA